MSETAGSVNVAGMIIWLALTVLAVSAFWRLRRRRGQIGPGATGAVYDMLNEDKRHAIELIVEQRAEARDPEDADGNLPELEKPKALTSPPPAATAGPQRRRS